MAQVTAAAWVQFLAWEIPHAMDGYSQKKKKKKISLEYTKNSFNNFTVRRQLKCLIDKRFKQTLHQIQHKIGQ